MFIEWNVKTHDQKWITFFDTPSCITVLNHDFDFGDNAAVKQNAFNTNPTKCAIMKEVTGYFIENGLAVPSWSPWYLPCLLIPKPAKAISYAQIIEKSKL